MCTLYLAIARNGGHPLLGSPCKTSFCVAFSIIFVAYWYSTTYSVVNWDPLKYGVTTREWSSGNRSTIYLDCQPIFQGGGLHGLSSWNFRTNRRNFLAPSQKASFHTAVLTMRLLCRTAEPKQIILHLYSASSSLVLRMPLREKLSLLHWLESYDVAKAQNRILIFNESSFLVRFYCTISAGLQYCLFSAFSSLQIYGLPWTIQSDPKQSCWDEPVQIKYCCY